MTNAPSHLVLGAGGIAQATTAALVAAGHPVVAASRSGRAVTGATAVQVDATDAAALARLAEGAATIVNALNPPSYTRWDRDWPPMAAAILAAAERTGAGVVTVSNLYGYGRVDGPMTEDQPLRPNGTKGEVRAQMWRDALARHAAGRLRATELRASDYFGPGAGRGISYLNQYVIAPAARGRRVRLVMGTPDPVHSWTYLADIGRLAARLATDDRSWGHAWHVPSAPPRSVRAVAADAAAAAGRPAPTVVPLPAAVRRLARVVPTVRALDETKHQFERPFVLDAARTAATFGLAATPWSEAIAATVAALAE